jgi:hypothetical protein
MFLITDKKKFIPFLLGVVLLFVGLTLSKALTSLVTVYFIVLYIFQKKELLAWNKIKQNTSLRWFFLFIGWMILSLLWTSDKNNGLKMLGSNLNFITWPILMVCFSSFLFANKKIILTLFSLIVAGVSIFQFVYFQGKTCFPDIREMALFVSHIRFALMVDIAFFISIFFTIHSNDKSVKFGWIVLVFWFLFYIYYSQVLTGLLGIIGGGVGLILFLVLKHSSKTVKIVALSFFTLLIGSFAWIVNDIYSQEVIRIPSHLPKYTALGNVYEHKLSSIITENGHLLDLYYCEKEVDSVWKIRSKFSLDDYSPKGHQYKYVIKRYLTSKGLTKDATGVNKLTKEDIKNIEDGISTIVELNTGLYVRYQKVKYELSGNMDPNGHSILQRFEFWKASKNIIQKHWLVGVGLGSSKKAFEHSYNEIKTKLKIENQWESHNQFLSVWVSFGLIGLLLFLSWLFLVLKNCLSNSWLYSSIFFTLLFSCFVEDTLGTLTGMTLFAFFIGLFQNQLPLNQD